MKKIILISVSSIIILVFSVYIYKNRFNNEDAKNVVVQFYELMKTGDNKVKEIYPEIIKIQPYLNIENDYIIKSVIKNDEGDFNVFTEYIQNKNYRCPISFLVSNQNGKLVIIESRGLSFSFYNCIYDFAFKEKKLDGTENDVEISEIIKTKKIENNFNILVSQDILYIKLAMTKSITIEQLFPGSNSFRGKYMIKNESNYDLTSDEINCQIDYFDEFDNIISSESISVYPGIGPKEIISNIFYPEISLNFSKYSINVTINETEYLRKQVLENY